MPTIYRPHSGRLTIAEAKRLILDASPRESFVDVYVKPDGTLKAVQREEPTSIYAGHLDEDFASNCEQLAIEPRSKYRPGKSGYAVGTYSDIMYTINHDEFVRLARLFDLVVEVGSKPIDSSSSAAPEQPARANAETAESGAPRAPAIPDWKEDATKRGWEIVAEATKGARTPSQTDIGDQISREWNKERRYGPQGAPLSGAYIRRHALVPAKVSCKKARLVASTNAKGKQGKQGKQGN